MLHTRPRYKLLVSISDLTNSFLGVLGKFFGHLQCFLKLIRWFGNLSYGLHSLNYIFLFDWLYWLYALLSWKSPQRGLWGQVCHWPLWTVNVRHTYEDPTCSSDFPTESENIWSRKETHARHNNLLTSWSKTAIFSASISVVYIRNEFLAKSDHGTYL